MGLYGFEMVEGVERVRVIMDEKFHISTLMEFASIHNYTLSGNNYVILFVSTERVSVQ